MRVCVISYHASPVASVGEGTSGGMSVYLSNLYKRLSRYAEVDIFCRGIKKKERIGNCNIIYLNNLRMSEFTEEIIRFHGKKKYDILHSNYWLSGVVAKKIKKTFPSLPWIHSFHTIEILKKVTRKKVRIEIEKEIMQLCDFIISPTSREKEWIEKFYPKAKVKVIPHGVSSQDFPFKKDGSRNILFVGRVDPIKGVEMLLKSLKFIKGDFRLDIVGGPSKDVSYYEDIKFIASRYPVHFLGKIPHKKLYEIYQDSCMLILPSYYESFGLVALEAMSCGRPVIGFSDTYLPEVVGKKAGVFADRDIRELAGGINFLLNNTSKRYNFGKMASKKAARYNWKETSRRYIEVYSKIIEEYSCNNGAS